MLQLEHRVSSPTPSLGEQTLIIAASEDCAERRRKVNPVYIWFEDNYLTVGGLMTQCSSIRAITCKKNMHQVFSQIMQSFCFCCCLGNWKGYMAKKKNLASTSSFSLQYSVIRATTWGGDVGTKTWRKMFATLTMGKTPDEGGIKTQLRQSSSSYFLKHFLSRAFSSQLWKRHLMVIRFDNKQKNSDVKSSHQAGRSWSSPLFLDPVKSYNYLTFSWQNTTTIIYLLTQINRLI